VHVSERAERVIAVGTTPSGDAPRPKRARALKSATTPPAAKRGTGDAEETRNVEE